MSMWYLFNDVLIAGELGKLAGSHERLRRRVRRQKRVTTRQVEEDVGQVALLLRSVTELCIERGIFSAEELTAKLCEVDMADGIEDGQLDLDVLRPGASKLADLQPVPVVRKTKKKRRRR